ncbi:MAG: hypothetical protein AAF821_23190 [Cyanobacteria bacterium P01_D01_bin.156]
MGPVIHLGERRNVHWMDRLVLDTIGWDRKMSPSPLNFSVLEDQAEAKLAKKLGSTVSWLNSNEDRAAYLLAGTDINLLADMAAESDAFYQLFGTNNLGRAGWWQLFKDLGYGGWWQEYVANDAYGQKAYFSTLEEPAEAKDVPEPTSCMGLVSLAVFGFLGKCSKVSKLKLRIFS